MSSLTIDRQLRFSRRGVMGIVLRNTSGGTVNAGAPVIYDTATTDGFTTTTVQNDPKIIGMCTQTVANGAAAFIQQGGFTDLLKVDGTTDIAAGDFLTTFTTAGIAAKRGATTSAGQFAIALEAYTTNDGNGVIDAWLFPPNRVAGATSSWGDDALLNLGTDNDIAQVLRSTALLANTTLAGVIEGTPATLATAIDSLIIGNIANDGDVHIVVSKAGNTHTAFLADGSTGDTILNAATGQSVDLYVAGTKEYDFSASALDLAGNHLDNAGYLILNAVTLPAATEVYVGHDNTGDLTANALTGKTVNMAVNGVDVATFGGAAITFSQALTINSDLTVTGSLTFGGNWTVGATLTVDELILDTDGVAPAATNCYWVRDNAGDLTGNAISGKQFIVAIANTDEYTFSATILDMLANALDNCGYIILNAATAPAGTEVYAVNDNTGDLTLNALTGKKVQIAIAGTDEFGFSGTAFEVASANNIQFLGDNGLLDSNGNEVLEVSATASATNGLLIKNAATGNPVIISAQGTGATADRGIQFNDSNGNEALVLGATANAVNELKITNNTTGNNPVFETTGGDANIGIALLGKGTGVISLNNGTDPVILQFLGAQAGYNNEIQDVNGNEILALQGVASAVNELGITNAIATANPALIAQGGDTNISITITPKAAGQLNVAPGTAGSGAAPDLIIQGDVDSGIFGGTNIIGIATGGTERLRVSAAGNIHVGNSTAAVTVGDHAIYFTNATVNPAGAIVNGAGLYCAAGELYGIDSAGNTLVNSPHSPDGDFIIHSYSAKKDKTTRVHLEKFLRRLAADPRYADLIEERAGRVHNHEW